MPLDLSAFEKALRSLKEALAVFQKDTTDTIVRDSVVQRYEYTYELTVKTVRRFLMESEPSRAEIETMFFSEIIRRACQRGLLLHGLGQWNKYRKTRNLTSHTYDEFSADAVTALVPEFIEDAEFLISKINEKQRQQPSLLEAQ